MINKLIFSKTYIIFVLYFLSVLTSLSAFSQNAADNTAILQLQNQFESRIQNIAESVEGIMGFVIKDLNTGDIWIRNEDIVFPQASVIKIPVLAELYRQAEAGILSLDDKVDINMNEKVAGSGVLQYLTTGYLELSLRDIAVLMIVLSDNTAFFKAESKKWFFYL